MKKGFCTSEKNIIDIREYMSIYLRETYTWNGKLTHKKLNEFLEAKRCIVPHRISFSEIQNEDLLKGYFYLVKDEVGKIVPYVGNPLDLKGILKDMKKDKKLLEDRRRKILKSQGLKETKNGTIIDEHTEDLDFYEDTNLEKLGSVLTNNNRVKKLSRRR